MCDKQLRDESTKNTSAEVRHSMLPLLTARSQGWQRGRRRVPFPGFAATFLLHRDVMISDEMSRYRQQDRMLPSRT